MYFWLNALKKICRWPAFCNYQCLILVNFLSLLLVTTLAAQADKPMRAGPAGYDQPLVKNKQLSLPGERWDLQLPRNRFTLQGAEGGAVTGQRGIRLEIMPDSFQLRSGTDKVEIEWIEVLEPVDYLLAGIPLLAQDTSGQVPLLSGGMVRLKLSHPLKPGKTIRVMFPDLFPQQPFYTYRLQNNLWIRTGTVQQEEERFADDEEPGATYRILDALGAGWYNLDYPEPETTCVKFTVQGVPRGEYLTVATLGIDHRSYFANSATAGDEIRINTFRDKNIKVVVLGNNSAGASGIIRSPANLGHMQDHQKGADTCTAIGSITLQPLTDAQRKEVTKLAEFLGL